jgi:uncharacterized protein YlxW (UPF0749 family)
VTSQASRLVDFACMQERLEAEKAARSAADAELKALKAQLQDQQATSAAEVQKLTVSLSSIHPLAAFCQTQVELGCIHQSLCRPSLL